MSAEIRRLIDEMRKPEHNRSRQWMMHVADWLDLRLPALHEAARRACACAEPDPVMQADRKFYCHRCSFETGARPTDLEPENTMLPLDPQEDPPRRTTEEAREFDAFLTAFEALQASGYYLHDAHGTVLDAERFKQAMCVGMNAIWQKRHDLRVLPARPAQKDQPRADEEAS